MTAAAINRKFMSAVLAICACMHLSSVPVFAGNCGGDGQRACCNGDGEFYPNTLLPCAPGTVYVNGCTDPNGCGCSGGIITSENSLGMCYAPQACGGAGQRACCNGAAEFSNNGTACDSGNVQLTGTCDSSKGGACVCGGGTFFSAGTCVKVNSPCGGKGQRACCVGTLEYAQGGGTCNTGLTTVPGCAGDCTCGGATAAGEIATQSCTQIENIGEPSTNSNPSAVETGAPWTLPSTGPAFGPLCPGTGLCGYADLHVHMWANLAHGGATLAGEPWDANGVNAALKQDYGLDPAVQVANGYTGTLCKDKYSNGVSTGCQTKPSVDSFGSCPEYLRNSPLGDLCTNQQLFHGDHTIIDTTTGGGTNDGSGNNLGAPSFTGWPQWTSTIHQQVYWKWLERAWLGGLRLIVMDAVTNETLCKSSVRMSGVDCTLSMTQIDLQLQAAKSFQTWLDTQYGGAGKGWFQIVTDPIQATNVIQQGKLAVVLGIEVDNLFNCHAPNNLGRPANGEGPICDTTYVSQQLTKYYNMGVRHLFPIHNFDNAYGAPAAWQDAINVGNYVAEGFWWNATQCQNDPGYGFNLSPGQENFLIFLGFNLDIQPPYTNSPPSCHASPGLTDLGKYLVQQAMNMGMVIDVDHMSIDSFNDTLSMANSHNPPYSGIAATHVQFFDLYQKTYQGTGNFGRHERMRTVPQLQAIKNVGGVIAAMLKDDVQDTAAGWCLPGVNILQCLPFAGPGPVGGNFTVNYNGMDNNCAYSTTEWAQALVYGADKMGGAVAMGSDFNGIAGHIGPRFGSAACGGNANQRTLQEKANNRLTYPFTLPGFGSFDHQVSGHRSFDFNYDGLAHIGLLPDMVADLRNVGLSDQQLQPLFGSAQAYITSWAGVAKVPPQITSANTANFQASVADTTFSVTATGLPAPTLSLSGTLPTGVSFNASTGVFSGTPDASTAGNTYPLTITAKNGILPDATQSFSLVVGQTPTFTNDPTAVFFVGQHGAFTFQVSVPLFQSVKLVQGTPPQDAVLPQGLSFGNTGTVLAPVWQIFGTPSTGTGGVYPMTEEILTLSFIPSGQTPFIVKVFEKPTITSSNSLNTSVGVGTTFQVTSTGFPAANYFLSGGKLPAGMDFDTGTGRFFGTPEPNSSGVYTVQITAGNAAGLTNQSFTITVNGPPTITSVNNATFTTGVANTFSVTTGGYPAPTVTFSGVSPSNTWLSYSSNPLSGTPPVTAAGKYTLTVTATNSYGAVNQSFTLYAKTVPTITWKPVSPITYGTLLGPNQLNATATAGGNPVAGTFAYSPAAGALLTAGSHELSLAFTPADTNTYYTATSEAVLQVNQATPQITWTTPIPITYGAPLSSTQLNASSGGVAGTFVYSPAPGTVLPTGNKTLSVTFNPTDTVDYTKANSSVMLTVNPATIMVTADSFTRMWGLANPTFTYKLSGFVNNESSSVVSGAPLLTTTATQTSIPGVYPIVVAKNTLAAANYTFALVNGSLTITPTAALPTSGSACNGAFTGTFQGNVQVKAGQYCIFVSGGPTGNLMSSGGTVILSGAKVGGNLDANGGMVTVIGGSVGGDLTIQGQTMFNIGPSTSIAHNLQIQGVPANTGPNTICATAVGNNLQFQNNAAPVSIGAGTAQCRGNTILGNLLIQSNSGSVLVNGNMVSGNLNDQTNTGPEQVVSNEVGGHLQCSGNSLITGSGNTAKSNDGQCAGF